MISYSLKDSGIFHVMFTETISAEDIKNYLLEFKMLNNLPQDFLALYDLRGVDMKLTQKDLNIISVLTDQVTSSYKTVKTAFLVDRPNITAYSILFPDTSVPDKTIRKVFSTEEAAIEWLK